MRSFLLLAAFFASLNLVSAPLALVYQGPGSCTDGDCSGAAAHIAELEGFEVKFIGPDTRDYSVFENAAAYIQPGGQSAVLDVTMHEEMQENIRRFVSDGGAYVGFCAGGFFAMEHIGKPRDFTGLGLISGEAFTFQELGNYAATILKVTWFDELVDIYWEGGPYFPEEYLPEDVEIFGRYASGKPANIRTNFGRGRVSVTAHHPEAPQSWRSYYGLQDDDGLDFDLARDMLRWTLENSPN